MNLRHRYRRGTDLAAGYMLGAGTAGLLLLLELRLSLHPPHIGVLRCGARHLSLDSRLRAHCFRVSSRDLAAVIPWSFSVPFLVQHRAPLAVPSLGQLRFFLVRIAFSGVALSLFGVRGVFLWRV